jgi:hypothetical protein
MLLNLGCGDRYVPGWHNVDHQGSPHRKDETLDLRSTLPWTGVTHVYAGHILEHLRVFEVIQLLDRLKYCMAPGGELMVVGPDCLIAQGMAVAGTLDVTMESLTHGGHRWPGDEHRWECTTFDVEELLRAGGWWPTRVGIPNVPAKWPVADRGPQWQCAVSATASVPIG